MIDLPELELPVECRKAELAEQLRSATLLLDCACLAIEALDVQATKPIQEVLARAYCDVMEVARTLDLSNR